VYWDDETWQVVEIGHVGLVADLLNRATDDGVRRQFVVTGQLVVHQGNTVVVDATRFRTVTFYPQHWLYELRVASSVVIPVERYESACAYVLVQSSDDQTEAPNETPPHLRNPAVAYVATFLDWSSTPIHNLNRRIGLCLERDGKFDSDLTCEYLDFFTSFIADETRGGSPFPMVSRTTLENATRSRPAELAPFEVAAGQATQGCEYERPPWSEGFCFDPTIPDPADWPPGTEQVSKSSEQETSLDGDIVSTSDDGNAKRLPQSEPPAETIVMQSFPDRHAIRYRALCLHQGHLFNVEFEIRSELQDHTVLVEMLNDHNLQDERAEKLRYQVNRVANDLPVLFILRPRREVDAKELVERLISLGSSSGGPTESVENLRVHGDVSLRTLQPHVSLVMRDVEFVGRVVLDGLRQSSSVKFENCKFARSFEARNTSIDGDLVFTGSTVFGILTEGEALRHSICLDCARIGGNLEFDHVAVDGTISANNAKVEGRAFFRGADVRARRNDSQSGGVSLRNANLVSGAEFGPFVPSVPGRAKRPVRTRIEYTLDMEGAVASDVDLKGCEVRFLTMAYARIAGAIDMSSYNSMFRTRIIADANLRGIQATEAFVGGAHVGGNLYFIYAHLSGAIFGRVEAERYRTTIGEDLILSGANVIGDCAFDGAFVAGAFSCRTGSIGRILLSPAIVSITQNGKSFLHYVPADVGTVEIDGVLGVKKLNMAGIQVRCARNDRRGIVVENLRVNGDILLYWGDSEDRAASDDETLAPPEEAPNWLRHGSRSTCEATVNGTVEFRKVEATGLVDLTNCHVTMAGGRVRLVDTAVGTDLFARGSALRGLNYSRKRESLSQKELSLRAASFDLESTTIRGDAILTGLTLRAEGSRLGGVNAAGLAVAGKLEFCISERLYAHIPGVLDLRGAKVADIVLCGKSFDGTGKGAQLSIEQAEIGSFQLLHPPNAIAMTGVTVRSWNCDEVKQYLDRLGKMHPFDQSVWVAVEANLRNAARNDEADDVYLAMKSREPSPWNPLRAIHHRIFGYGTRVRRAFVIAVALWVFLFAILVNASNAKPTEALTAKISDYCKTPPPKTASVELCDQIERFTPIKERSAAEASQLRRMYGFRESFLLSLKYAIPPLGLFDDPSFAPMENQSAHIFGVPLWASPSAWASLVRVANALLISFGVAFVTRRWLR
jgi:uncharacterized protein YjbI with pentapeptide repeats